MAKPNVQGPYNEEAESSVLGSAILAKEGAAWICERLDENDFYVPANRILFSTIKDLHLAGSEIDLLTLRNALVKHRKLDEVGGENYLIQVAESTPSVANVAHYGAIVYEYSVKRAVIDKCNRALKAAMNGVPVDRLISYVESMPDGICRAEWDTEGQKSLDAFDPEGVTWLWDGVVRDRQINLLEGKGSIGKSTIVLALAMHGSIGRAPMTGLPMEPFKTIYIGRQDSGGNLRYVFDTLGGDPSMVLPISDAIMLDSRGLRLLEKRIERFGSSGPPVRLFIVDPVKSYMPNVKTEFDNIQIGRFFDDLRMFGQRTGVTPLCLRHFVKYEQGKDITTLGAGGDEWRNSARSQLVCFRHPDREAHPRQIGIFPVRGSIVAGQGEPFGADWWGNQFMWIPPDAFDLTAYAAAYPAVAAHYGFEQETSKRGGRLKSADRLAAEVYFDRKVEETMFVAYGPAMQFAKEHDISRDTMQNVAKARKMTYGTVYGVKGWIPEGAENLPID